jgi:hypothetical protein
MSRYHSAPGSSARPLERLADQYSPAFRPTLVDFFCILIGFTISLVLTSWSKLDAAATAATPQLVAEHLLGHLPTLLLMPVGILLFWPLFFFTQWVRGRREWMSSGEWLWGLAWLAVLPLVAWLIWQRWDTPPEPLDPATIKHSVFVGYAVGALALGSLALLIALVGLLGRWRQPWTHTFCLALLIWPLLPVGALFLWDIKLQ